MLSVVVTVSVLVVTPSVVVVDVDVEELVVTSVYVYDVVSVVVVVVTARPAKSVDDVVTIPTEVDTPLNVDAGSITIGVSVVASVLPVVVSVATTTLVTCDVDIVATVPTPEAVYFVDVVVDNPPE